MVSWQDHAAACGSEICPGVMVRRALRGRAAEWARLRMKKRHRIFKCRKCSCVHQRCASLLAALPRGQLRLEQSGAMAHSC